MKPVFQNVECSRLHIRFVVICMISRLEHSTARIYNLSLLYAVVSSYVPTLLVLSDTTAPLCFLTVSFIFRETRQATRLREQVCDN